MQYNESLFGAKQDVYNNAANDMYMYSVGTKNTNAQAALISQDFSLNSYLPDDIFYWMIDKDSPYSRYTLQKRTGSNGAYTWDTGVTDTADKDIPIVLTCRGNKHNSTTINIDSTGSGNYGNNYDAIPNRLFIPSSFAVTGSPSYPLWFETDSLSDTVKTHQTGSDFIVDFDYNNIIAVIQVNGNSNGSTRDLANYNNTSNNYIYSFGYSIVAGVIDDRNNTRIRTSSQTRYIGSNNIGTTSANAAKIVTDYHYKTAGVMDYYSKTEFALLKTLDNNTHGEMIFDGSLTGTSTSYAVNYYMDNEHWELSADGVRYQLKKHGDNIYNDDDFNYIRRCIAYLGFWFTDGGIYTDNEHSYTINRQDCLLGDNANTYAESYMIPDRVYQAEIKNGVTTGNFTELRIAKDNDQSKWGKDWREKNGYNGRSGSDEYKDRGNLKSTLRYSSIPTNTRDYAMTGTELRQLITWCNSGFQVTDSNQFLEDFKGLNPADCVISALYFPFDVGTMATTTVHVGNLDTGITTQWANMGANFGDGSEFTYSPLTINREFGDFRDYAPYTTIDIYVPFCGSVSLDPADVYGYDLTVTIIPDLMTGSCTGCIYRGEYLLQTIDGKIGMPITLSLGQVGDYQNAVTQAQFNLKNANRQMFNSWLGAVASVGAIATGAGAVVGIAGLTGSAMGMLQAQDNIKKAEYDLAHIARNFNTVGSVSDVNTVMVLPEYVHVIIKRPYNLEGADISQYAHTVGHACNRQGYVSDFSGYTLASDIDLSGISATADELEQIRKYFATGIYL